MHRSLASTRGASRGGGAPAAWASSLCACATSRGERRIEVAPNRWREALRRVEDSRRPCSRLVLGAEVGPEGYPRRRRRAGPAKLLRRGKSSTLRRRSATFVALRLGHFPRAVDEEWGDSTLGPRGMSVCGVVPTIHAHGGREPNFGERDQDNVAASGLRAFTAWGRTPPGRVGPVAQALKSRQHPNVAF